MPQGLAARRINSQKTQAVPAFFSQYMMTIVKALLN
jgi:hypothetical protein